MAATILRDKLKREIESAIKELKSALGDPELIGWVGQSKESIQKLIEELS
jgi:hypothetical protein